MTTVSVDPMLGEYSRLIDSLEKQLNVCKHEQKDLKSKVLKLLAHNRRITNHLKAAVEISIIDDYGGNFTDELQAAVQSKTACTNVSLKRVSKTNSEEISVPGSIDINKIEKHIAQIIDHYKKGFKILTQEYTDAKKQLVSLKKECGNQNKQLEFCQSCLEKAENMVKCKEKCIINLTNMIQELKKKLLSMETYLLDRNKLFEVVEDENSSLKRHDAELHGLIQQLKQKVSRLEHEKSVLVSKATKSLLDSQNAVLEKNALAYKEQLALAFINDLKLAISQEMEHKNFMHKHKVKAVIKEYESKILELLEEVKSLQLENSEKQSLFEKAIHEKTSIESKLKSTSPGSYPLVSLVVFEELHKKLSQSEKLRDEASLRIESLENSLRDLQQTKVKETDFLRAESDELRKQIKIIKKDLNEALRDRFQLVDQAVNLRERNSEIEKQLQMLQMQQEKEISRLKHSVRKQHETLEHQMQINEEQYRRNISHLHQVLRTQYLISKKWKNALQELTLKSELKIKELLQDMTQLQQQHKSCTLKTLGETE